MYARRKRNGAFRLCSTNASQRLDCSQEYRSTRITLSRFARRGLYGLLLLPYADDHLVVRYVSKDSCAGTNKTVVSDADIIGHRSIYPQETVPAHVYETRD